MRISKGLCNLKHSLESREGRSQQYIIVRVSKNSRINAINGTTIAAILELVKEVKTIKAISESSQYFSLADTITDGEAGGDLVVPPDIGELAHVHVDDEADEDQTDTTHHFTKQN